MRGKNIIYLSLIATLLLPLLLNISFAPPATKLSIDPKRIPEQGGTLGHPDLDGEGPLVADTYDMTVKIEGVSNLWAIGFTIQYAPYGRPLAASEVFEGDFMKQGGYLTAFTHKILMFPGQLKVSITRLYQPGAIGASGDGTVITFKFTVVEAGSSDYEITDLYMVDPDLNPISCSTWGGSYYGCEANLINLMFPEGRISYAGDDVIIKSKAINKGDVPMWVRTRFDIERVEDGRRIRLYSGQTYFGGYLGAEPPFTELMCDGYELADFEGGWNFYGDSPWLDAIEDGNLINSTGPPYSDTGFYTFEDISLPYLGIYGVVSNVDFYGYAKISNTDWDIDPYAFTVDDEGNELEWMWCDSMGESTDWDWTGCKYYFGRYNFPEYYGFPLTETAINNAKLALEFYGPGGVLMEVDALKMRVEFATITPLQPPSHEIGPYPTELELQDVLWKAVGEHVGHYIITATLEYTLIEAKATGGGEVGWMEGAKTRTIHWEILP